MLEIDGSQKSGSGTVLGYALTLACILNNNLHTYNIRSKRKKPGLQPQHLKTVEAFRELTEAAVEGARLNSKSIGFYSGKKNSQSYPLGFSLFYPNKGNFIAIVSNLASGHLLKSIVKEFKKVSYFPLEYLVAPVFLAPAISFSDNWSFWRFGYKAVMITDTAFYRNPYYHTYNDTPEKLDYQSVSQLIEGLYGVLLAISQ